MEFNSPSLPPWLVFTEFHEVRPLKQTWAREVCDHDPGPLAGVDPFMPGWLGETAKLTDTSTRTNTLATQRLLKTENRVGSKGQQLLC